MNYLNISTDSLKSEEFIGAEPIERATWIALLGWCASQENGGVISDCADWSDRKWQQLCGVTKTEVETQSDLFAFEDGNLIVVFYPKDQEAEVIKKRKVAKANGKRGGRPRKPTSETQQEPTLETDEKPTLVSSSEPRLESVKKGKGKKGKEKKRKNTPDGVSEGGGGVSPPASRQFEIPTLDQAQRFAVSDPSMIPPDSVEAWLDDRTSLGWEKPKGQMTVPIRDWRSDLRGYGRSWRENHQSKPEQRKVQAQERSPL